MSSLPNVRQITFWNRKQRFLLPVDTYSDWVAFIVEAGSFRYRIAGEDRIAGKGEIIVCPPHTDFHREIVASPLTFHFIRFNWNDGEGRIPAPFSFLLDCAGNHFGKLSNGRLAHACRQFRSYADNKQKPPSFMLDHYLSDVLIMLYESRERSESAGAGADPLMEEAKKLIEDQAFKPLRIQDVAAALHLSTVQLSRRFLAAFRIRPIDYLTEVRMGKAKLLLTDTNFTIDHIAGLCGYDNGFYLSRVFTRQFAIAPSQYRQQYRL